MDQELRIDLADGVLTLTIDRPACANALSAAIIESMLEALEENARTARLAIVRGNGAHFCSGFDLADLDDVSDGDLLLRFVRVETLLQRIHYAPFPTLALAHGRAIGAGADLFAACSMRIATPGASFRMPGWQFGIALGTRRLVQRVGADAARDLLLASRTVGADEAQRIGLAQQILPEDQWPEAIARARGLSEALTPPATADLLALTAADTREVDMAALVATASRPGLKQRILAYREKVRLQAANARSG